jgi:hypothetical protein
MPGSRILSVFKKDVLAIPSQISGGFVGDGKFDLDSDSMIPTKLGLA